MCQVEVSSCGATDVGTVAEKLEAFCESLTREERSILKRLLQRTAEAPGDDVGIRGYTVLTCVGSSLATASSDLPYRTLDRAQ